jgi:ribulose-5-phosphate 4-epimerase/fuculose-1-phosphate aldolase
MTENELRVQMVELARSLFDRGFSVGGAGNLSLRLPDGGILVTPTASSLGRLDPDRLSKLDADGNHVSGDKPSKDFGLHTAMYATRPDCGAVVHLHSTYLTALSCLKGLDPKDVLRAFTPYYVMRVGALPMVPYYKPAHPGIARDCAALARSASAFLLANHGSVVLGKDFVDAVNNAEELEETAKLYFLLSGRDIRYLTVDEVAELRGKGP